MEITNGLENLGVFKDYSDGTLKTVFNAGNNEIIEMTLLFNKEDMDVVCAPTHHFCNLGCKMCHLTNKGLNKEMKAIEIDYFIEALVKSLIKPIDQSVLYPKINRRTDKKKLLISFMGVGEPLLNLKLVEELYGKEAYLKELLGYEEIGYSLSTMMPNHNIYKLTRLVDKLNMPLKVHFSLHTPEDKSRNNLIPANKMLIEEAMTGLIYYRKTIQGNPEIMDKYVKLHRTNDPIEIHYTLIKDVNDDYYHLSLLTNLLKKYNIPIKFISFNPINDLEKSNEELAWISQLQHDIPGLRIKTYAPPGREIGSSCGEFTKHYYHEQIETEEQLQEFNEWKKQHEIFEKNRLDYLKWDEYFMAVAKLSAMRSKDPSTQVGACIVSQDNRILSIGYNGAPNGFDDEKFPWDRDGAFLDTKYAYTCHAELNAILNYNGSKKDLNESKIYVDLFPCNECAKAIIQSGIKEVIYLSDKYDDKDFTIASKRLFDNCGITYTQFIEPKVKTLTINL